MRSRTWRKEQNENTARNFKFAPFVADATLQICICICNIWSEPVHLLSPSSIKQHVRVQNPKSDTVDLPIAVIASEVDDKVT